MIGKSDDSITSSLWPSMLCGWRIGRGCRKGKGMTHKLINGRYWDWPEGNACQEMQIHIQLHVNIQTQMRRQTRHVWWCKQTHIFKVTYTFRMISTRVDRRIDFNLKTLRYSRILKHTRTITYSLYSQSNIDKTVFNQVITRKVIWSF